MQIPQLRHRLAILLEPKADQSKLGKAIDLLLAFLILLNVVAVILATVPELDALYEQHFEWFNIFSVVIFTFEYGLRVWTCIELDNRPISHGKKRLSYLSSPMAMIDLIVILPFYIGLFFTIDLRILRVLRLLRIFKLGRYSSAMQMLVQAFKQEYRILLAAFSILLIMMVLAASGMYLIEKDIQPEKFGSIPDAMWWAITTLTTVGYGDVTPVTPWGKFFGGTITLLGMGMVALPAGILASSFSEQAHQKRETFKLKVKQALADGKVTQRELAELELLRHSLDIDRDEAKMMFSMMDNRNAKKAVTTCPHCHKPI
ncbi:ion transporter [Paraglaciecola sp. MB-3u-78]|jgi:voltage-gated potassium channel|uniref:ion transporter n=1 Tax=Paraglaciecola sp. MB-3u-78 TaxID=2058332 RepID=UPI000C323632|nr:ion transporter [Paraglaciecola sp. MB-3u-78]PKG97966.1 Ion transport protein [Paraglaciecola sp. MB-3u-78]